MKTMRAKARAHTMQGLVKYHGLRDRRLRIPYHNSVSVNLDALWTVAEVDFYDGPRDVVIVNAVQLDKGPEYERVVNQLDLIRKMARIDYRAKVVSHNHPPGLTAKGLGFSSSAGAAITAAAYQASGLADELGWDEVLVSRLARHFAGSACRTVVGGYAKWIAGTSDETSYGVRIGDRDMLPMSVIVVPLYIEAQTEEAHMEAETSCFFQARISSANERAEKMEWAIRRGDFKTVGELSELDSLELHAVTMTGGRRMILMTPESLKIVHSAVSLRKEGLPVYFSMQTGPTVYLDMPQDVVPEVVRRVRQLGFDPIVAEVAGPVKILEDR